MPLKTWAPYDRLLAEDLNAAYRYASGDSALPGTWSKTPGALLSISLNNTADLALGAPAAGADPLGYFQAGKVRCPVGMAGVHLFTLSIMGDATTGTNSNAGAFSHVLIYGVPAAGQYEAAGSFHRFGDSTAGGCTVTICRPMADGEEWYPRCSMRVVAGAARVLAWSIARLGPGFGPIGS